MTQTTINTEITIDTLATDTINAIPNFNVAIDMAQKIKNSAKTQRGYYLKFGQVWLEVRKLVNKNTKLLNHIRTTQFVDAKGKAIIDAQTASYAAQMAEKWSEVEPWAKENKPYVNNPRPLMQAYNKWIKSEEERKLKEAAEKVNGGKAPESKAPESKAPESKAPESNPPTSDSTSNKPPVVAKSTEPTKTTKTTTVEPVKTSDDPTKERELSGPEIYKNAIAALQQLTTAINTGKIPLGYLASVEKQLKATKACIDDAYASAPMEAVKATNLDELAKKMAA